jgi:NAD(P)H-flavin reductase
LDEFENWAKIYPDFKFIPTIDDVNDKSWKYNFGYINKDIILKNLKDVMKPIYYIVGPPQMVDAMEKILLELNVNPQNIKLEKF